LCFLLLFSFLCFLLLDRSLRRRFCKAHNMTAEQQCCQC
jgi:hypothetical protein